MDAAPLLSIVIPVKDEEATIPGLAAEIDRVMATVDFAWEAVWVDDGSSDRSAALVRGLKAPHRMMRFDRNHGQSAAFLAGFRGAIGEWVGTLDGDGQNDPADLPRLLAHARATGVDMCNGIRTTRRDSLVRRVSSRIGNGFRNWITGEDQVRDVGCSTRVARRALLVDLPFFHGMHRFLPTLVRMRGGRLAQLPVNHRPRGGGSSKYGVLDRAATGMRDCFGVRWLRTRAPTWTVVEGGQPWESAPPSGPRGGGVLDRVFLHDSFGMRWLRSRARTWTVVEEVQAANP
jgi:dolichol-phosphate mannosyltransferase